MQYLILLLKQIQTHLLMQKQMHLLVQKQMHNQLQRNERKFKNRLKTKSIKLKE